MTTGPLDQRFPTLFLAHRNLRRTPVRSGLSILAILVGVVAVATLGMAGTSLERSAVDSFGDVGGDIVVSPAPETGRDVLRSRDVRSIRRAAAGQAVVPLVSRQVTIDRGRASRLAVAYGSTRPDALFHVRSGRSVDALRSGALVGADLADDLEVRAGNAVRIDGRRVRVRGVISRRGPMSPIDPNRAVVLPRSRFADRGPERVLIRSDDGERANETARVVRSRLNGRQRQVSVVAIVEIRDRIGEFFGVVDAVLLGIGGISLGVGGLGILNVMLLSTAERRAEIGLLRAVGFHKRDVLAIVLWEAGLLGVAGAAIGLAVSLVIGVAITAAVLDDPSLVLSGPNLGHLARAAGIGVIASLLSGLYPAWKAAADRPVDALRP